METLSALAALYAAAGLLLCLRLSGREETHAWPPLAWLWVATCWPAHLGQAWLVLLRPRLRSAWIAALLYIVRWGTRRLEAQGLVVGFEPPPKA